MITMSEPSIQIVQIGQTVRFDCNARPRFDVSGPLTVSWAREEGGLQPGRARDDGNGLLIITQVQTSDSGSYVCTATAGQFVVTSTTELTVGDGGEGEGSSRPAVVINPQYKQARVGQSVTFTCEADGRPQPSLSWSKQGGREALGPSVTVRGPQLYFARVRKEDEGRYTCRATNTLGSSQTETVLYVTEAEEPGSGDWGDLSVTVSPEDLVLEVGARLELRCRVEAAGQSQYSLEWTRDRGDMSARASQRDGVLTLLSVALSDSGLYSCTARGPGGRTQQSQARVTVRGQQGGPPQVSVTPDTATLGQGDSLELRCEVTGGERGTWSKVGEELSGNSRVVGGSLLISQARVADRGLYLCEAQNAVGTGRATAVVEVEPREAPRLEIYPESAQTINSGGSVLYQCRAVAGIPSPVLTWTRTDLRPLTANTEVLSGGVLRITRVTGEEEGEYICRAENSAGSVEATASLTIHQTPSIQMTPRGSVTVRVGSPLTISCAVTGDPPPSVTWKKITRTSQVIRSDSPSLELSSVRTDDEGTYACVASNLAGQVEERLQVIVTDDDYAVSPSPSSPPSPPSRPPRPGENNYPVVLGNNVKLVADIVGNFADIRTTWRKESGQISGRHFQRGNTLYINNAQREDAGVYICQGRDSRGNVIFEYRAVVTISGMKVLSFINLHYCSCNVPLSLPPGQTDPGAAGGAAWRLPQYPVRGDAGRPTHHHRLDQAGQGWAAPHRLPVRGPPAVPQYRGE